MPTFFIRLVAFFQSIHWTRTDKVAAACIGGLLAITIACSGCVAVGNAMGNTTPKVQEKSSAQGIHATDTPWPTYTLLPTDTPAPTDAPAAPSVVFDVTSRVSQERTSAFTLQDPSQLVQWWCDPSSGLGGTYNVIIEFYTSDGTNTDVGISDMCEPGNTSGEQVFHMPPGTYKLDLFIQGWWHIKVTNLPF